MPSLLGLRVPDVALPTTGGTLLNLRRRRGRSVLFIYPYTGRSDHADPEGWDSIRGAHGSTPQSLAYGKHHRHFSKLGVAVFGLSFQDVEWQDEFVVRNRLPFILISDHKAEFATKLGLRTFVAGGRAFLQRRTLLLEDGKVLLDRRRIDFPKDDAAMILKWLRHK